MPPATIRRNISISISALSQLVYPPCDHSEQLQALLSYIDSTYEWDSAPGVAALEQVGYFTLLPL